MKKLCVSILIVLLLGSCDDSIRFEEPQPSNQPNLRHIPKQLRGSYFSSSDSTQLTINDHVIIDWTDVELKIHKDSLDFEIDSTQIVEQSHDFIKINDGKFKIGLKFFEDSVLFNYSYRDTIFEISDRHILRRFKGHYFLNYKRSDGNWKVRKLSLKKRELSFSKVRIPEDIDALKQITEIQEVKSDSGRVIGYNLNPSRKELKQLMKHSFSETKTYKRVK
jgi:hypothetical protein